MTPGEAAYRVVSGGRSLRTERASSLQGILSEIQKAAGGTTAAAARAVGVHPRTWQKWRAGSQKPRPERMLPLRRAQRRARLSPKREAKLRAGQGTFSITGTARVSNDERPGRGMSLPGHDVDPAALAALVDDFLSGAGEEELAADLQEIMQDYVPGMELVEVDTIHFD